MAKKDDLPATQPEPDATASPDKNVNSPARRTQRKKAIALVGGDIEDLDVMLNDLASNGYRISSSLIRAYAKLFSILLNNFSGLSNTPLGKRMIRHRLEIEKKREEAKNAKAQAKADIDRAIAKRIETAESVEIEETFDASGKGHAGFSKDDKSTQVGVGGEGQRVVKRNIILRGTVIGTPKANQVGPSAIEASSPIPSDPIEDGKASPDRSVS